jgi:arsenate reductase-like glutaredoxin family protein
MQEDIDNGLIWQASCNTTFQQLMKRHKFHEARDVLKEGGISIAMLNIDTTEIQADDIDAIARTSAIEAAKKYGVYPINMQ